MTNKEVIDKLQNYLLKQDAQLVTRICANFAIDLNRFLNLPKLTPPQRKNLLFRVSANMKAIHDFTHEDALELELFEPDEE